MYLASNSESDSREEPDISLKAGAAWPGRTLMLIAYTYLMLLAIFFAEHF